MAKESVLKDPDSVYREFATAEKAAESVKLKVGRGRERPVPSSDRYVPLRARLVEKEPSAQLSLLLRILAGE